MLHQAPHAGVTPRAAWRSHRACDERKPRVRTGAFHGTDLQATLQSRDIDTVIVTGIATNVCCDTTAREAAQRSERPTPRLDDFRA